MSYPMLELAIYDPGYREHVENWVIDGLLTAPSITFIASPPKVGKTVLATTLAVAVATGQPFLGRSTTQGSVLWLACEESRAERRRLLDQIPYPDGPYPFPAMPEYGTPGTRALPIYTTYTRISIDNAYFNREVRHVAELCRPKLIVLDPFVIVAGKYNLGCDLYARRAVEGVRWLADEHQAAVLALHNARNMRHCANSLQLETAANAVWLLDREGEEVHLDLRGRGQFANQTIHARSPQVGVYEVLDQHPLQARPIEAADLILAILKDQPLTAREIALKTDQNLGTIRNALTKLKMQGKIATAGEREHRPTYTKSAPFTPEKMA